MLCTSIHSGVIERKLSKVVFNSDASLVVFMGKIGNEKACGKLFEIYRELRISIPQVHLGIADCSKTPPNGSKKDGSNL